MGREAEARADRAEEALRLKGEEMRLKQERADQHVREADERAERAEEEARRRMEDAGLRSPNRQDADLSEKLREAQEGIEQLKGLVANEREVVLALDSQVKTMVLSPCPSRPEESKQCLKWHAPRFSLNAR